MVISEVFGALGIFIALIGGVISAFSTKRQSPFIIWMSSYLVLIAGLSQFLFAYGWQELGGPFPELTAAAFTLFNLGNIFILYGTFRKRRRQMFHYFVNTGGVCITFAMLFLLFVIRSTSFSFTMLWYIVLVSVVGIFMIIGVSLSHFRGVTRRIERSKIETRRG